MYLKPSEALPVWTDVGLSAQSMRTQWLSGAGVVLRCPRGTSPLCSDQHSQGSTCTRNRGIPVPRKIRTSWCAGLHMVPLTASIPWSRRNSSGWVDKLTYKAQVALEHVMVTCQSSLVRTWLQGGQHYSPWDMASEWSAQAKGIARRVDLRGTHHEKRELIATPPQNEGPRGSGSPSDTAQKCGPCQGQRKGAYALVGRLTQIKQADKLWDWSKG